MGLRTHIIYGTPVKSVVTTGATQDAALLFGPRKEGAKAPAVPPFLAPTSDSANPALYITNPMNPTPTQPDPAMECAEKIDGLFFGAFTNDTVKSIAAIIRQHYPQPRAVIEPPARAAIAMAVEALERCLVKDDEGNYPDEVAFYEKTLHPAAESALPALRAHLDTAPGEPTDREMLDWLEKQNGVAACSWDGGKKLALACVTPDEMNRLKEFPSIRSAIRAAMQAKKEATP